jgi:hypothetical protein
MLVHKLLILGTHELLILLQPQTRKLSLIIYARPWNTFRRLTGPACFACMRRHSVRLHVKKSRNCVPVSVTQKWGNIKADGELDVGCNKAEQ